MSDDASYRKHRPSPRPTSSALRKRSALTRVVVGRHARIFRRIALVADAFKPSAGCLSQSIFSLALELGEVATEQSGGVYVHRKTTNSFRTPLSVLDRGEFEDWERRPWGKLLSTFQCLLDIISQSRDRHFWRTSAVQLPGSLGSAEAAV
jgi:hypothetical protein